MRAICCSMLFLLALAVSRADTIPERAFRMAVLPDSDCYFRCENTALIGTTAERMLDFFTQPPAAGPQDNSSYGAVAAFLAAVNRTASSSSRKLQKFRLAGLIGPKGKPLLILELFAS